MTNPKEPATDASEVDVERLAEMLTADKYGPSWWAKAPEPGREHYRARARKYLAALITTQSERIAALEGERDLARACIPAMATEHRREQDEWKAKLGAAEARCEALELALREAGEAMELAVTLIVKLHEQRARHTLESGLSRIQAVVGTEGGAG